MKDDNITHLLIDDKISEPHLETEFVGKLKLKEPEPVFGNFELKGADLKQFVKKLRLDQMDDEELTDEDVQKFYEFVGPDFAWPPTMDNSERSIIFDSVVNPKESKGEEYAKNLIAYRRFTEAGQFDSTQGTHVLIVDGKIAGYGSKLWGKEYRELMSKYPQALYAPLIEEVVGARFSSIRGVGARGNEWQVHMRIRRQADPTVIATMANIEIVKRREYRLVLDTGATYTVIPQFVKERMGHDVGWSLTPKIATGYASNTRMYQVSEPWEVSLGDGANWTDWVAVEELYVWQERLSRSVNCGLVGFDVLNNTYQIKVPNRLYGFVTNMVPEVYTRQLKSGDFETYQTFIKIQFRKNKPVILFFKARSIKLPVRILKKAV